MLRYAHGFSKSLLIIGLTLAAVNVVPGVETPSIYAHMAFSSGTSVSSDVVRSSTRAYCYPNPYRPESDQCLRFFTFADNAADGIEIVIWDLFGNHVWTSEKFAIKAGDNDGRDNPAMTWNGQNRDRHIVHSGGYISVIRARPDSVIATIKIAVVR